MFGYAKMTVRPPYRLSGNNRRLIGPSIAMLDPRHMVLEHVAKKGNLRLCYKNYHTYNNKEVIAVFPGSNCSSFRFGDNNYHPNRYMQYHYVYRQYHQYHGQGWNTLKDNNYHYKNLHRRYIHDGQSSNEKKAVIDEQQNKQETIEDKEQNKKEDKGENNIKENPMQDSLHFKEESFPIAERNIWDTLASGMFGMYSLITSQANREEFMDAVTDKVIHQTVATQARFGNLLSLALYYDVYQNQLWKEAEYHPKEFLDAVAPALEQFHELQGQLLLEVPDYPDNPEKRAELVLKQLSQLVVASSKSSTGIDEDESTTDATKDDDSSPTFLEQAKLARKDPESLSGRLARMVTPSVWDAIVLSTEGAALTKTFELNSTKVENVALLSARCIEVLIDQRQGYNKNKEKNETDTPDDKAKKESAETEKDNKEKEDGVVEEEEDELPFAIAAQIEVLYDVKQTFASKKLKIEAGPDGEMAQTEEDLKPRETTQVIVGTFNGWLKGGPNGQPLRWRISRLRVPYLEFPDLHP